MAQKKKPKRDRGTTAKNVRHMQTVLAGIFLLIGAAVVIAVIALMISYM
jgi:hypothetical protein